jgi:hypothetical protein
MRFDVCDFAYGRITGILTIAGDRAPGTKPRVAGVEILYDQMATDAAAFIIAAEEVVGTIVPADERPLTGGLGREQLAGDDH